MGDDDSKRGGEPRAGEPRAGESVFDRVVRESMSGVHRKLDRAALEMIERSMRERYKDDLSAGFDGVPFSSPFAYTRPPREPTCEEIFGTYAAPAAAEAFHDRAETSAAFINMPRELRSRYFAGRLPEIKCAVCNAPIKKVVSRHDQLRRVFVYEFHCHGSVERAELDETMVQDSLSIELGLAFQAEAARLLAEQGGENGNGEGARGER